LPKRRPDRQRAEAILADEFANAVREEELNGCRGVNSVPTVVFNGQYAVTGGNR
jgi:predicted DsbA family dithiol-disulfide isomerase